MRYRIMLYPLLGESLAIVSTYFEHFETGTDYSRHYQLKTHGEGLWPLPDLLREVADQIVASTS